MYVSGSQQTFVVVHHIANGKYVSLVSRMTFKSSLITSIFCLILADNPTVVRLIDSSARSSARCLWIPTLLRMFCILGMFVLTHLFHKTSVTRRMLDNPITKAMVTLDRIFLSFRKGIAVTSHSLVVTQKKWVLES